MYHVCLPLSIPTEEKVRVEIRWVALTQKCLGYKIVCRNLRKNTDHCADISTRSILINVHNNFLLIVMYILSSSLSCVFSLPLCCVLPRSLRLSDAPRRRMIEIKQFDITIK